jgi:hypothetical protein
MTENINSFLEKKLNESKETVSFNLNLFLAPYLTIIDNLGNLKYSLKINGPLKPSIPTGEDVFVRKYVINLSGKVEKNGKKVLKVLHEIRKEAEGKKISLPLPFSKMTLRNYSFCFNQSESFCSFSLKFYGGTYRLKLRKDEIRKINESEASADNGGDDV